MSVHYKFKSTLDYDTVSFDGLHISVADLKKAIFHQKRIGKNTDFDLQITNAQTKEDYIDDNALIAKNTSLIVARVPITVQQKKSWDRSEPQTFSNSKDESNLGHAVDLTRLDGSEEDKIRAMMTQSTQDYDPSNYMKIRGANQSGDLPPNYLCYKCHQPGHWIKNCPLGLNQEPIEIKKSTGIPRSFMVPVEGPLVPGAMMTPTGQYAVPAIDHQAYKEGKKERPPFFHDPEPVVKKPEIPEDLLCNICKDLLTDAVMIPCCGNSFCDECIRTFLLESEEHECPDCNEKDVSPETLIPNRFLRNAVMTFKNETGYAKRQSYRSNTQNAPSVVRKETEKKENQTLPSDNDAKESCQTLSAPPPDLPTTLPEPLQVIINTNECLSQSNVDDDTEAVPPPPPGTEPLLPILPLINKSPGKKSEPSNKEKKDDNYEYEENKPPRERRPSFSKENNRDRNADNGRRMENLKPMNRRRSHSPRHSHHGDYLSHNTPLPHMGNPGKGYQSSSSSNFPRYSSNMHYDSEMHRSNEDRPGTPTVDEPHLHLPHNVHQSHLLYPPGEDRISVLPPPNYNQPPPSIPPHNAPLLPDPYMTQRMPLYTHQQGPHYGMARYDRPPFPQSGFRAQGARNYAGPPRGMLRGMHHTVSYRGIQPPPPGLGRNYHNGNPTGVIDDPLEAFERMLREKDERDRRLGKHRRRSRTRSRSRSYTRSRSRSFARRSPLSSRMSRSRSPTLKRRSSRTPLSLRQRSRTPKRRSRSGSFSISRSRSYSRSQSPRGVTIRSRERDRDRDRDFPSRYRSPPPVRSPIRFQRDRESARSRESRERHNSYYNDLVPNDSGFKDRDRDILINKEKPAGRYPPRNTSSHHNIPPLLPSLNAGGHPPPLTSVGASSERKDYYETYNRYPGTTNERLSSPVREAHHKRIDEVAPPGTEGYYDLAPPGVDYPEKPNKDDRERFRVNKEPDNQVKDSIVDARDRVQIRDDRLLKDYDDDRIRERDDRNRRGPDSHVPRDHERERDKEKEDRDRLNMIREREERFREKDVGKDRKDRDEKYNRDRRDDDRFIDKKEHERERYRDDRDRHKFEERNRNRDRGERKERDYEMEKDRERQDRYKEHLLDRKKSKRSSSPYMPKNRNEIKGSSPERLRKKEKSYELKPDDKKKEKKIKDKKKKKDSEEKEKKKKKKKDKKSAQKETEKVDVMNQFSEAEKASIDANIEDITSSNNKRNDQVKASHSNIMKNTSSFNVTLLKTEFENKSLMINPEPPELVENDRESEVNTEFGINPPNPNFEPIPELKAEIKPIDRLYSGLDDAEINALITDKYSLLPNVEYENNTKNRIDKSSLSAEKEIINSEKSSTLVYESRSNLKKDEVLAPMPELSKWERDDNGEKLDQLVNTLSRLNEVADETKSTKVVTSEVIKRAENAIFQKAINAIRPIEIKKISENRKILYQNPEPKVLELDLNRETRKNVNVTINVDKNERNVEITELSKKGKLDRSKFKISSETCSPTRLSAKERLGDKIDDDKEKRSAVVKTFVDKRDHNKPDNFMRSRSPKFALDKKLEPFTDRSNKSDSKNNDNDERKVFFNDHRNEQTKNDQTHEKADVKTDKYDTTEGNDDVNNKTDLSSSRNEKRENVRRIHTSPRSVGKTSDDSMKLNFLKRKKDEDDDKKEDKKSRSDKKRKKEHRSRSKSKERKKRKEKKHKKDKSVEKKQKYKESSSKRDRSFVIDDIHNLENLNASQIQPLNRKQRKNPKLIIDRKRSALDEASFEPDYSASDSNSDTEDSKLIIPKKPKLDESKLGNEKELEIKLIKRKNKSSSTDDDVTSSSDSSTESASSEDSHKKRKKKHKKHKKHKSTKKSSSSDTDSDSDYTDSSSNDEKYKKKSKKSKSKNKQSKKKKKSKHK